MKPQQHELELREAATVDDDTFRFVGPQQQQLRAQRTLSIF
jgi:hypothetical protein